MISAWKRLINKDDASGLPTSNGHCNDTNAHQYPPGVHKLDKQLQRKFAKGVNYNLKIVIKGDNRVGKTSLMRRLQGEAFNDQYTPTENLNFTSIDWNYKATDDVIKVDIWEAVDPTWRKSNHVTDLKLELTQEQQQNGSPSPPRSPDVKTTKNNGNNSNTNNNHNNSNNNNCNKNDKKTILEPAKQSLEAANYDLDVYKNTDAVVLLMDMTKTWTFKYIQAEILKIPKTIPVLVVANFKDQGHHRSVTSEQVKTFIAGLDRTPCDATIMYAESSMRDGFGLKLIDKFFSIPYLKAQELALLKQLELNRCDFMSTNEELELMQESIESEYKQYVELKTLMRRQQADALSPVNSGQRELNEDVKEKIRNTTMSSQDVDKISRNAKSIESSSVNTNSNNGNASSIANASKHFVSHRTPSIVIGAKCQLPDSMMSQIGAKTIHNDKNVTKSGRQGEKTSDRAEANDKKYPNNDDDDDEDDDDDDDDEEEERPRANPLVADYQSDLDPEDE